MKMDDKNLKAIKKSLARIEAAARENAKCVCMIHISKLEIAWAEYKLLLLKGALT